MSARLCCAATVLVVLTVDVSAAFQEVQSAQLRTRYPPRFQKSDRDTSALTTLGVKVEKPSATLIDQLDLPRDQGQLVMSIAEDTPAAKAGLKVFDIIFEMDGLRVSSDDVEFAKQLRLNSGDRVDVVVIRKGRKETIKGLLLP